MLFHSLFSKITLKSENCHLSVATVQACIFKSELLCRRWGSRQLISQRSSARGLNITTHGLPVSFLLFSCRKGRFCIYTVTATMSLSRLMGKPTICIGENKDADQLRGNREADQRLCFRYSDSTIPLLIKSETSF